MKKIELKSWTTEDIPEAARLADNPKIANNLRNTFPSPYSLKDAEWYINDCIEKGDTKQLARAIWVDDKLVGSISICVLDDVYCKSAELGYWLGEPYWRQGIMSEAAKIICGQAFKQFDLERIYAEPFEHNKGSRGVLEKAGFTLEGIMRNGVYKNGEIFSYCMYSKLKTE